MHAQSHAESVSGALLPVLRNLTRHADGSVALIDRQGDVLFSSGELFSAGAENTRAERLQATCAALGDASLESDLRSLFTPRDLPSHDFVTPRGCWLRRTLSLLEVPEPLALLSYRDVSHEHFQDFFAASHQLVTEALGRREEPAVIFQGLARLVESCSAAGTHASVLWLQPDGKHLRHVASPSLPQRYVQAIDGVAIGPSVGSCGTAACTGKRVVVADIASDPLWSEFREVALKAGLRACWSQPVLATDGRVLGTLAMYRESPGAPGGADLTLLQMAVQMASLAIRDLHSEGEIRFQAALLDSVREAVIATDPEGRILYWGSGATRLLGYEDREQQEQDLLAVIDMADGLAQARHKGQWNGALDVEDKCGHKLTVEASLSSVTDRYKRRSAYVVILRDITSRRAEEARRAQQSRQRQLVAELGRVALGDMELQALFDLAMKSLAQGLDVPLCKLLELEADENMLRLRAGVGWHEGLVGQARVSADLRSQAGFTLLSATPVVVENLRAEDRFDGPALLHEHSVRSGASVIVPGYNGQAWGVLGVHSTRYRHFSSDDISFIQSVANVLAESIRRRYVNASLRRSEQRLRQQANELEMVNWINSTLAAERDLEKLVQTVIDVGTRLSGADFGAYFHRIANHGETSFELYALAGMDRGVFSRLNLPAATDLFSRGFQGAQVIRADDMMSETHQAKNQPGFAMAPGQPGVRSYLAVPVVSRSGETLGGMLFGHPDAGVFTNHHERLMLGLATQASIAVDNASVYRDLRDSKNQVRRQFEQLNAIYATAPIGLCFLDDHLQLISINDQLRAMIDCRDAQVEGKSLSDIGAPAALEPVCREVLSTKSPVLEREIACTGEDGRGKGYWLCSCYPILEPDGSVLGINTVAQDITGRKRGEIELARLGSIIANSYDAIIGKTLKGIISSWNQGAERIFGYAAEEAIGQPISIIIPDDRQQEELDNMAALRDGRAVTVEETTRVRKDGSTLQVALTLSPIRSRAGEVVGVSTIARDITASRLAQEALRENEERMRLILQATQIGTWEWHIGSGSVRWSENMEQLHGRQPGSFQGTLDSALQGVYPEDRRMIDKAIAFALEENGDFHVEFRVVTDAGQTRWIESKGQTLCGTNGTAERMAGVSMDVTTRKEAEQALRVSETMLRTQTEELATAHRQKDEFLAMLAHELRNPLAPISNAVQLLKIQTPRQREKNLPWAIDVIDRQVAQISRLVDDLLDIARFTRGRIELQSEYLDLRDVVHQAAETAAVWFNAKHQNFQLECPDQQVDVMADATRMVQAVSNLLNNASKFTAEYGRISLRLYCNREEAIVVVADNGIGISADILAHVFEPFTQGDRSLDRRKGGLGLGLSLVKKLVDMHGGQVYASSPGMGRGSEFTLRLPLATAGDQQRSHAGTDSVEGSGVARNSRILVVDDNVQSADAMAMLLETLGHSVKAAYSGPDALRTVDGYTPQIVFLDIGLPFMDGYEVAEKLRARLGPDTRLIALTGYGPKHGRQQATASCFDDYILKPVSLDTLTSMLSVQRASAE